jgi:hypothetical protein
MSIGGIKRDENISILGTRAESDRHRRCREVVKYENQGIVAVRLSFN